MLDSWMGRDDDKFTSSTCGLSVPRQNGKNALLEMRELYGLCVLGERILHTSHAVKTSAEAFRRYSSFFENKEEYPELYELCDRIRRTNGQKAIELKNGGIARFSARSRGAARGMTFDVVVFDGFVMSRIVSEMDMRDREWLCRGKIPAVTYVNAEAEAYKSRYKNHAGELRTASRLSAIRVRMRVHQGSGRG